MYLPCDKVSLLCLNNKEMRAHFRESLDRRTSVKCVNDVDVISKKRIQFEYQCGLEKCA